MSHPIITLTNGHISIKRGKRIRKYTPGLLSTTRLCNLLIDGPAYVKYTSRSSIYTWQGESTLTTHQKSIYAYFIYLSRKLNNEHIRSEDWKPIYYQWSSIKKACELIDINPILIELVNPCKHGYARSICVTCCTEM